MELRCECVSQTNPDYHFVYLVQYADQTFNKICMKGAVHRIRPHPEATKELKKIAMAHLRLCKDVKVVARDYPTEREYKERVRLALTPGPDQSFILDNSSSFGSDDSMHDVALDEALAAQPEAATGSGVAPVAADGTVAMPEAASGGSTQSAT